MSVSAHSQLARLSHYTDRILPPCPLISGSPSLSGRRQALPRCCHHGRKLLLRARVCLPPWHGKQESMAATAALLILGALDEPRAKKPRSCWVYPWLKGRLEQGVYENLMQELALGDGEAYHRYIRMDTATFEDLLQRVVLLITKRDTPFRPAIIAGEHLAITLSHLANGG